MEKSKYSKGWETRRKNGNSIPYNKGHKGEQVAWNKGMPMKEVSKEKLRRSINNLYKENPEVKIKISSAIKAKWKEPEYRKLCEEAQAGEKSYRWNGKAYKQHLKDSCERCGSDKFILVHHKDRSHDNASKENLETLCSSCHSKEHQRGQNFRKIAAAETK